MVENVTKSNVTTIKVIQNRFWVEDGHFNHGFN